MKLSVKKYRVKVPKFTASKKAKKQSQDSLPGSVRLLVLYRAVFLGVFLISLFLPTGTEHRE